MIALKRAKSSEVVRMTLHPEFITEYADTSLFEAGFHKPEDGYEFLEDSEFQAELALNETRHEQFLQEKRQRELQQQAEAAARAELEEQQRIADLLVQHADFIQWKVAQGSTQEDAEQYVISTFGAIP
jgi:hypothetical protein